MVQLLGDFADGQTVSMQLTDSSIVVHRKHPCPPAAASTPHAGMCYGSSLFEADRVSHRDADHHLGNLVVFLAPTGRGRGGSLEGVKERGHLGKGDAVLQIVRGELPLPLFTLRGLPPFAPDDALESR